MPQSFRSWLSLCSCVTVLALGAAACAVDSAAPTTPLLTQAQADSIAEQVVFDVDDENAGATMTGLAGAGAAASFAGLGMPGLGRCAPTRTPESPADSDNDGVADSVRIDFTGCVFSFFFFETDTVRGTIDVLDPTPLAADRSVERVFTELTRVRVHALGGKSTSETRNGRRRTQRDATTLEHTETDFRTDYVFRNGGTASHVKTWTSRFTADVPGSIHPEQPLPSGAWSIGGTSSWTRGARSYALTVTTDPPLHYDAGCSAVPRFDAGVLVAVVTRGEHMGTVRIEFTACGAYTVTRS